MNSVLNTMPSVLNLVPCKSPIDTGTGAQCYQGVTSVDVFSEFIVRYKADGVLNECTLREHDRYSRLLRTYYYENALVHAVIDIRAGIVHLIVYSLVTNKISELEAEYFVYQIRQHLDRF